MNKKALLVAPALGVLLLAAAGSVGGTVAWFSAVSNVNLEASKFQVTRLDGNLTVDLDNGVGTTTNDAVNPATVSMTSGDLMAHASYDHTQNAVTTVSSENDSKVRVVPSGWLARTDINNAGNDVYFAVSWDMTFTFTFAREAKVNLYFDPASSLTSPDSSSSAYDASQTYALNALVKKNGIVYECTSAIDTPEAWTPAHWQVHGAINGFRLAFCGLDAGTKTGNDKTTRIWAPFRAEAAPKYVDSTATLGSVDISAGTGYDSGVVLGSAFQATSKITEGTTVTTKALAEGYLGQFVAAGEGANTIKYRCVAWFEGTDAAIVGSPAADSEYMKAVAASLKFYTREYTGA